MTESPFSSKGNRTATTETAFKALCWLAVILPLCLLAMLMVDTAVDSTSRLQGQIATVDKEVFNPRTGQMEAIPDSYMLDPVQRGILFVDGTPSGSVRGMLDFYVVDDRAIGAIFFEDVNRFMPLASDLATMDKERLLPMIDKYDVYIAGGHQFADVGRLREALVELRNRLPVNADGALHRAFYDGKKYLYDDANSRIVDVQGNVILEGGSRQALPRVNEGVHIGGLDKKGRFVKEEGTLYAMNCEIYTVAADGKLSAPDGTVVQTATLQDAFSQFLASPGSARPGVAGIWPALVGSFFLLFLTVVIAIPVGVGAAIYLEEYAGKNGLTTLIEININNLAGVPSIIYGLLGLELFAHFMNFHKGTVLTGSCTMALLILPVVITASREALRQIPQTLREASWALGADRWQTIWRVVLPMSFPSVLTGVILSMARAIGETAPLVTIGCLAFVTTAPTDPMSGFTVLPVQIFNWVSSPQHEFRNTAAAGIVVLLVLMLSMNAVAIYMRNRMQKRINW